MVGVRDFDVLIFWSLRRHAGANGYDLEHSWPEASTYNKSSRITKRTDLKGDFF